MGTNISVKKKRKRRFLIESPEELQRLVDAYFLECQGVPSRTEKGDLIVNQYGDIVYDRKPVPPTMSGLSLACGYRNRHIFARQKNRSPEFEDVVSRARLRLENYNEMRLYDRNGYSGASFALWAHYGWIRPGAKEKEKTPHVEITVKPTK